MTFDVTRALLALVNLAALALLFKVGLRVMRDYDDQVRAGLAQPVFDPAKFADLDIDQRAWADAGAAVRVPAAPAPAAPAE